MTRKLDSIPVAVVRKPPQAATTGNALAILHQIEAMLESLVERGETNKIDLRRTPLTRDESDHLKRILGEGEVRVEMNALGLTRIRETAVSGVWWVTHQGTADKVLAEFVEVTACPDMLMTPEQDIRSGRESLRMRLDESVDVVDPGDIEARVRAMGLSRKDNYSFNPTVNQPVKRGKGNAG